MADNVYQRGRVGTLCYYAGICPTLNLGTRSSGTADGTYLGGTGTTVAGGNAWDTTHEFINNIVKNKVLARVRQNIAGMIFPITIANTLSLPLQNRSVPFDCPDRIVGATLRAMPEFHGHPRYDNVRVLATLHTGRRKVVFGKCCCFIVDCRGNYFVAVQWYVQVGRSAIDPASKMAKVALEPERMLGSYDVVEASTILNGALLVEDNGTPKRRSDRSTFWVRQSPREAAAHVASTR